MIQKTRKKKWALLLAVCMLFSMMPTSVFAATATATVDFNSKQVATGLKFTTATGPVGGMPVEAVATLLTSGTSATGTFTFSLEGGAASKFELVGTPQFKYSLGSATSGSATSGSATSGSATSGSTTVSFSVKVAAKTTLVNGDKETVKIITTVVGGTGKTLLVPITVEIAQTVQPVIKTFTPSSAPTFYVGSTHTVAGSPVAVEATFTEPTTSLGSVSFKLDGASANKFVLRSTKNVTATTTYDSNVMLTGSATNATATIYVAVAEGQTLALTDKATVIATPSLNPAKAVTVKINVVPYDEPSTGSGGGNGGGGYTPTTTTTTTASQNTIDAAIKNGSNVVLTVSASAPSVSITNSQIASILKAGIDLVIQNSRVAFSLDKELLNSTGLSDAKNVTIALTPATVGKTTADKLEKMDARNKDLLAATAFDITIKADGKAITTFSKPLELKFSLSGLNLTAAQISKLTGVRFTDMSKGKFNQLGGKYDEKTKSVTMYTSKLSTYGTMISDNLVSLKLAINKPAYTVNGKSGSFEVAPRIINDRTMVPLAAITEMFGAKVTWIPDGKIVKVELDGKETSLVINQKAPGMDTPAIIVNDRTLVPLGYIADQFESNIIWTDATKSLEIYR